MPMTAPSVPARLEIVSSRLFDAPRAAVFEAFEDPAQLRTWWGPQGFTSTIHAFDFRPGGEWKLTMHGPDGTNYDNQSRFVEIEKPARVVFEHLSPVHWFVMTMTFADAPAGNTALTWRMVFEATPENEKLTAFLRGANEQNFDRLEAVLRRKA